MQPLRHRRVLELKKRLKTMRTKAILSGLDFIYLTISYLNKMQIEEIYLSISTYMKDIVINKVNAYNSRNRRRPSSLLILPSRRTKMFLLKGGNK